MSRQRAFLIVVASVVFSHLLLLSNTALVARALAALALTWALPGALLVMVLAGPSRTPLGRFEWLVFAAGAGYGLTVLVMLALSYLPGGLAWWQTLAAFDLVVLVLLALWAARSDHSGRWEAPAPVGRFPRGHRWVLAGVLSLLLVGGFYRLTDLGYAEFQGDEARAVLRAAAVLQGDEDVLFLHKKGPAEILLPAAIYSLTGQMTEHVARLPFAIANLAGLVAVFVLGWRLFGPVAGWSAAILLALDGYFIGFARIVQYQSVVFLSSTLVVLVLYRLLQVRGELWRHLLLASLFLVAGLMAHYEAVLAVLPAGTLLWVLWRRGDLSIRHLARALLVPGLAAATALAGFYLPFILHPNFRATFTYLTGQRIGGGFPYNNLSDFFVRTTLYSTTYYVVLMIALAVVALGAYYRSGLSGRRGWVLVALLSLGVALTGAKPNWLRIGETDYTFLFFALVLLPAWFLPRASVEERTLWIWFGVPLLQAFFFTEKPRTHVYVFFIPWALLAGMVVERGFHGARARLGTRRALAAAVAAACLAIAVFGTYAYWYFIYNRVEILRTWAENRPPGFWTVYDTPDETARFGFPHKSGWKVIGVLYDTGVLSGPYKTDDDWVPDWYTRGQEHCARDHAFLIVDVLDRREELAEMAEELQRDYRQVGTVVVNNQPRLLIYRRGTAPVAAQVFDVADYEARFDAGLSGPWFKLREPAISATIQHPLRFRLGDSIWLEGYSLDRDRARPGEVIELTLYWSTTAPITEQYTVFNQLIEPGVAIYAQLDGQPGCETNPTTDWRPGDLIVDRYRLRIVPDARPGTYPLLTGMYQLERGERLEVYDAGGQPAGNAIELTRVTVEPVQ